MIRRIFDATECHACGRWHVEVGAPLCSACGDELELLFGHAGTPDDGELPFDHDAPLPAPPSLPRESGMPAADVHPEWLSVRDVHTRPTVRPPKAEGRAA